MTPRAEFDTEQVRDKARKDLLHLLEGVSRMHLASAARSRPFTNTVGLTQALDRFKTNRQYVPSRFLGSWQEESRH